MINSPLVAFLNLPWSYIDEFNVLRRGIRGGSRWPFSMAAQLPMGSANVRIGEYLPTPWFLFSAAGWAKKTCPEFEVVVRDSIARHESISEFNAWWCETAPTHVVIETGTPCWANDLKFIRAMKQSNPEVQIAVFGPNARELSQKPDPAIDAFLLGEPDKPAARFLKGERGSIGFDLVTREELNALMPFPEYDEPVFHHYADSNPRMGKESHPWPELTIWASRGCFAKCNFCSWPATMTNDDPTGTNKRAIRFYHPDWLLAFICERISVSAKSGKPLRAIRYDADTENASDRHTQKICEVMRKVSLPWSMMCRADTTSREVWQEMKDAGCFGVKLGFESGSDRIVNQVIGKKLDLKAAEETARFLRGIGMEVHGTFILGHPTETKDERKMTIDFIRHLYATNAMSSHQLSGAATISGTPLANAVVDDPDFVKDSDGVHKLETLLKQ